MSDIKQYDDARIKQIIRPQKARIGCRFDDWVTIGSEKWQKQALVQIRRYQSLECNDGFFMDTSDQCWCHVEIYPFVEDFYDERRSEFRQWLIGGAAFSKFEDNSVEMDFCWIHPFFRNKGLLKCAWPTFKRRYGNFYVSHPRTEAMKGFLSSIGYIEPKF